MQQNEMKQDRIGEVVTLGTLFSFFYCMMISRVLLSLPLAGGMLYLAGQSAVLCAGLWWPDRQFSASAARLRPVTLLLTLLVLLALVSVPATVMFSADFGCMAGIVLSMILRTALTRFVTAKAASSSKAPLYIWGVQALFLLPVLLLLLLSPLDKSAAWMLADGCAVSGILECFPLRRAALRPQSWPQEEEFQELKILRNAHAVRVFRALSLAVMAGLQVTQVFTYTAIALTADAFLPAMGLALLCPPALQILTDALLCKSSARKTDPNKLLRYGFTAWLGFLLLFVLFLGKASVAWRSVFLSLSAAGAAVCVRTLIWLEEDMDRVAIFTLGHIPGLLAECSRQNRIRFGALAGQGVMLAVLTVFSLCASPDAAGHWVNAFRSMHLLLTVPALLSVCWAILCALRFPLTKRHLDKLRRYTDLWEQGLENTPLREQLEAVAVEKSHKPYGLYFIEFVLRVGYPHKVKGKEKVRLDEDTPCVFVCNHGEINGPVVATLFIPYPNRPWSTHEIVDAAEITERTMTGTFQGVKGPLRKLLHWFMVKFGAPLLAYLMKSVESIPVYHDNPRMLRQTFRDTVAAMEAGDNLLIFPENAATAPDHRYVKEGVSEFFTGFTMIGQLYSMKTGKCPLFIPVYADKTKRTITFGTPTRYNAEAPVNDEKERLCTYLRGEMLKIAGISEDTSFTQ